MPEEDGLQQDRKNIRIWPLVLLGIYIIEFILLGIAPYDRIMWATENSFSLLIIGTLVVMYWKGIRFSNLAYTLAASYLYLHTIGGHFTFELVPFDWVSDIFGFERNHFDRVCHFLVGTFAYMAMEFIEQRRLIRNRAFAAFLVIMGIFGVAAVFEIIEWLYAAIAAPEYGDAFLGSQGDIWDAQKDMLSDGLGAMTTLLLYVLLNPKKKNNPAAKTKTAG